MFLFMKAERWLKAPVSQASADPSSIPRAPRNLETMFCICNPNTPTARWEESQENFSEALGSARLECWTQQKQDKPYCRWEVMLFLDSYPKLLLISGGTIFKSDIETDVASESHPLSTNPNTCVPALTLIIHTYAHPHYNKILVYKHYW